MFSITRIPQFSSCFPNKQPWKAKLFHCRSCRVSEFADQNERTFGATNETNEWFASSRIPMLCAKNSGIARGQTLQVARKKCMAKSCFDVQKNDFGERSMLFRLRFIENGFGQCWYMENVSFLLNNREICDEKLLITSLSLLKVYCEIYIE